MDKPTLAIIGLGRYYRKLEAGIAEHFSPVLRADAAEIEAGGGLMRLVRNAAPDAVMLLTPNHLHCEHLLELAELGLPTLVEKPLVTTEEDLDLGLRSVEINHSVYCSDFYADVRATPLLAWVQRPYVKSLEKWIDQRSQPDIRQPSFSDIGPIRQVEAVLLEGKGDAGSFEGREWLWDPVHGGVLWDLAYHYIVLWHRLFGTTLSVDSGEGYAIRNSPDRLYAESYASLQLRSPSGIQFRIRVGKYHEGATNERWFRIDGSSGRAEMTFQDPNVLRVQARSCSSTVLLLLSIE